MRKGSSLFRTSFTTLVMGIVVGTAVTVHMFRAPAESPYFDEPSQYVASRDILPGFHPDADVDQIQRYIDEHMPRASLTQASPRVAVAPRPHMSLREAEALAGKLMALGHAEGKMDGMRAVQSPKAPSLGAYTRVETEITGIQWTTVLSMHPKLDAEDMKALRSELFLADVPMSDIEGSIALAVPMTVAGYLMPTADGFELIVHTIGPRGLRTDCITLSPRLDRLVEKMSAERESLLFVIESCRTE